MLVPISENLEERIRQNFSEKTGNYWMIRVIIDDMVSLTGEPSDYFAQLILNHHDTIKGRETIIYDSEVISDSIVDQMKKEKTSTLMAKGYLLQAGYSEMKDLEAIRDEKNNLWCYPSALKTLNLANSLADIKKIGYDVILTFPDKLIYLKAEGYGELLRKKNLPYYLTRFS